MSIKPKEKSEPWYLGYSNFDSNWNILAD